MDTKFDLLKAKVVFSHEVYLYTVYILSNTQYTVNSTKLGVMENE